MNKLLRQSLLFIIGINAVASLYAQPINSSNNLTNNSFNNTPTVISTSKVTSPLNWYMGVNIGLGNSSCDDCGGYTGNSGRSQELVADVNGGFQFNQYLAAEASLNWLPHIISPAQQNTGTHNVNAIELAARASLPLGKQWGIFGKIGTAVMGIDGGLGALDNRTITGLYYASGISYIFSPRIQGVASVNYIQADTFGTQYHALYGLGGVEYLF